MLLTGAASSTATRSTVRRRLQMFATVNKTTKMTQKAGPKPWTSQDDENGRACIFLTKNSSQAPNCPRYMDHPSTKATVGVVPCSSKACANNYSPGRVIRRNPPVPADKQIGHHPRHSEKSAYYPSSWKSSYYPSSKFQPENIQRFELNMGVNYIFWEEITHHVTNPNQIQGNFSGTCNFPICLLHPAGGLLNFCGRKIEYHLYK